MDSCVDTMISEMYFCKAVYLQDGRVGAPLAGLDVASHSVSWHLALIETKAAFLWARTTHTYQQTHTQE